MMAVCTLAALALLSTAEALPRHSRGSGNQPGAGRGGSGSGGSGRGGGGRTVALPGDLGPQYGEEWAATVSSNMTQVGFDMGLVIVNFTGRCTMPNTQRAKTVYGDFYTLLLLCDQGIEYEIAPASRGGGCVKRVVGGDLDPRVCEVCSCPFCIRDTNGQYPNTTWDVAGAMETVDGESAHVWRGHQTSTASAGGSPSLEPMSHAVSVAFTQSQSSGLFQPFATNISDHLWVTSRARIGGYVQRIEPTAFDVPDKCLHPPTTRRPRPAAAAAAAAAAALPAPVGQPGRAESDAERAALIELARATNLGGWVHSHGWLSSASVCDWELVGCNGEGRVKLLTLDFNNLVGTLPESLGRLSALEDLDLEGNSLRGAIPSSLGGLNGSLLQLGLGGNAFSGALPPSLCGLDVVTGGSACDLSGSNFSCPLPGCLGSSVCGATCA